MKKSTQTADGRSPSISNNNDLKGIYTEVRRIRTMLSEGAMNGRPGVLTAAELVVVDLKVILERTIHTLEKSNASSPMVVMGSYKGECQVER